MAERKQTCTTFRKPPQSVSFLSFLANNRCTMYVNKFSNCRLKETQKLLHCTLRPMI